MDYSLKEKILMWVCSIIGHKVDRSNDRYFKGEYHNSCSRCLHQVSYPTEESDL